LSQPRVTGAVGGTSQEGRPRVAHSKRTPNFKGQRPEKIDDTWQAIRFAKVARARSRTTSKRAGQHSLRIWYFPLRQPRRRHQEWKPRSADMKNKEKKTPEEKKRSRSTKRRRRGCHDEKETGTDRGAF